MAANTIKIDQLAQSIAAELAGYSQQVTDALKAEIRAAAQECKAQIQLNSPSRTGKYKRGWAVKTAYESEEDLRVLVYNRSEPTLTHLLENGHVIKNGTGRVYGRVQAQPHIAQAEQAAAQRLEKKARVIVKG